LYFGNQFVIHDGANVVPPCEDLMRAK